MNVILRHDYSSINSQSSEVKQTERRRQISTMNSWVCSGRVPYSSHLGCQETSRRLCLLVYKVQVVDGRTLLVIGLNGTDKLSPTMLSQILSTDYRTLHRFEIMTFGSS